MPVSSSYRLSTILGRCIFVTGYDAFIAFMNSTFMSTIPIKTTMDETASNGSIFFQRHKLAVEQKQAHDDEQRAHLVHVVLRDSQL